LSGDIAVVILNLAVNVTLETARAALVVCAVRFMTVESESDEGVRGSNELLVSLHERIKYSLRSAHRGWLQEIHDTANGVGADIGGREVLPGLKMIDLLKGIEATKASGKHRDYGAANVCGGNAGEFAAVGEKGEKLIKMQVFICISQVSFKHEDYTSRSLARCQESSESSSMSCWRT
jgi:hypothetical protein